MILTPRPTLYQLTEAAATAAAARMAEATRAGGLAPATPAERQDRHGSNLEGRPDRGAAVAFRRAVSEAVEAGQPFRSVPPTRLYAASGFQTLLLAQRAPAASSGRPAPAAGPAAAAYRSAQSLQRRTDGEEAELFGPYPSLRAGRGFDLQV